jgi:hypothetical protein
MKVLPSQYAESKRKEILYEDYGCKTLSKAPRQHILGEDRTRLQIRVRFLPISSSPSHMPGRLSRGYQEHPEGNTFRRSPLVCSRVWHLL